jgi:hypothetical protein
MKQATVPELKTSRAWADRRAARTCRTVGLKCKKEGRHSDFLIRKSVAPLGLSINAIFQMAATVKK